jgi:CRP-like cAMP-binding protein
MTGGMSIKPMTHGLILQHIAKHITLDEEEAAWFVSLLKEEVVVKKGFILKEGQVCKNISYVHAGMLRAYYLDATGRESTIMFAISDWWITDMYCFVNRQPAMLYIEAVEDSLIFQLSMDNLDRLYAKVPKFERFFRILLQNAYIREQLRMIQNLSLPAKERYEHFMAKYPGVAGKVTQKQIASYLGITPEFLSMIRAGKRKDDIS